MSGLIIGSEEFVWRIQDMLSGDDPDRSLPALEALRPRPALERIVDVVADSFDVDADEWGSGCRHDGEARAVTAYLARRRFGYRVTEVAVALGYASHGGVVAAIRRVEDAPQSLQRRVARLGRELTND